MEVAEVYKISHKIADFLHSLGALLERIANRDDWEYRYFGFDLRSSLVSFAFQEVATRFSKDHRD